MKTLKEKILLLAKVGCVIITLAIVITACSDDGLNKKQTSIIDSLKVMPKNISVSDSVFFATFSEPFSGDCTYHLNIDSINDTRVYISGKFESDAKCAYKGANDTINIGLFPVGTYEIIYKFMDVKQEDDIVPNVPVETYSIKFVVSQ